MAWTMSSAVAVAASMRPFCPGSEIGGFASPSVGNPPISGWSAAGEVGGPLLAEGLGALLGVVGGEDGPADRQLVGEAVDLGHALGLPERAEHGLHGQRAVAGDQLGHLLGPAHGLTRGHHLADEA